MYAENEKAEERCGELTVRWGQTGWVAGYASRGNVATADDTKA